MPAPPYRIEEDRLAGTRLHFAWEGPLTRGARHYYRVQGEDLLIEYDTTDNGNHAHAVLRRPVRGFRRRPARRPLRAGGDHKRSAD